MHRVSNTAYIQRLIKWDSLPAPVKSASASKKDLSLAVNDETLEKMRQIGYNEASKGKSCGDDYHAYVNKCLEAVAPDRSKLFAEAESKMRSVCNQLQRETGARFSIFDYIFEAQKKDKEYRILETSGILGGGSFRGKCGSTGWININAFDENGESIGFYSTHMEPGWRINHTEVEKACIHALAAAYAEGTKAYYAEEKAEGQALRKQILSQMDFYA